MIDNMTKRIHHSNKSLRNILLFALFLRCAFVGLNLMGVVFPGAAASDVFAYADHSYDYGAGVGFDDVDVTQSFVWSWVIAVVRVATGRSLVGPLLFNALLGTLVVYYAAKTVGLYRPATEMLAVAWLLTIAPTSVMNSATLLRENAVILPMVMSMYYGCKALHKLRYWPLVWATAAAMVSTVFHGAGVIIVIPLIVALFGMSRPKELGKTIAILVVGIFSVIIFIFLAYEYEIGASKVHIIYRSSNPVELFEMFRDRTNHILDPIFASDPLYRGRFQISSLSGLIAITPYMVFRFMFAPFFDTSVRVYYIVAIPSAVLWGGMFLWRSVRLRIRYYPKRTDVFLLVYVWIMLVVYAYGSGSISQAYRHFFKIVPLITVCCSYDVQRIVARMAPRLIKAKSSVKGRRAMARPSKDMAVVPQKSVSS